MKRWLQSCQTRAMSSHEIRIVGGQWKRTKLPVADKTGLRPTPDRVRETLFNWLGQDLRGWHCLDVFAGTGALGLEAASRGAASVTLVEQDATLVSHMQKVAQRLQASMVQIRRGDGLAALRQAPVGAFHLILLDPPFDSSLFEPSLAACGPALLPQGWVYLEAPVRWTDESLAAWGLTTYRYLKAGAVHAHLLKRV